MSNDWKKPEEEDEYRWLLSPGIYCDHYSAQLINKRSAIVRIAFGEYVAKGYAPIYRQAVTMPLTDIKSLVATLEKIISEVEARAQPEEANSAKS